MDYLPGQYGMHYERIGLNDYHFDSLGLAGHRPYYAFAGNQLATGEQSSNGNYYWMQQQHSGQHLVGQKQYELTNHLGNVQVTVSDLPYKHGNDTMTHISPALKAVYDYYPFGSPMPGRTIMDTARKCVDMTRLDRVWKAWEMTMTEIYALSLINYHLDGEGEVFIDDNGAVEVETADEHAVFYMDLQDSLNNGGEMVLHVDWLKEFSEKGFLLYVQGLDATGEMRVFYQKHYEKPEDAVYLSIADSFMNISVGIQGNLHFRLDNIRYAGGSWVNEEVLVRVCDDGGDRYRFGFNGMLKDNEWAGMGTHLDFGARIYDSRSGRWLSVDPLAEKYPGISTYAFVANNPLMFVDPDGREIIPVHGTWSGIETWENLEAIADASNLLFGDNSIGQSFPWSGANYAQLRTEAALSLIDHVRVQIQCETFNGNITLVGHSHGGNVSIEALNMMVEMREFDNVQLNLLTINTPVRDDYQLSEKALTKVNHVNIYDPKDPVQSKGGNSLIVMPNLPRTPDFMKVNTKGTGEYGPADRTFDNADNIPVDNPQGIFGDFHNSHNRVNDWIEKTELK